MITFSNGELSCGANYKNNYKFEIHCPSSKTNCNRCEIECKEIYSCYNATIYTYYCTNIEIVAHKDYSLYGVTINTPNDNDDEQQEFEGGLTIQNYPSSYALSYLTINNYHIKDLILFN